jgi:phage shock protein A
MNNPAIEQALFELDESLKQIKSANEIVSSVSEKSEYLIVTMTKVIASLNSISSNLSLDNEALQNQLAENNKALKKGITKIVKDSNDEFLEIRRKINEDHIWFSKELEAISKNIEAKLNAEIDGYKKAIEVTFQSIDNEVRSFETQITLLQESTLKLETSIRELEVRISETDFKYEFEKLKKSSSTKNVILIVMNVVILAGVLALIIKK